MNYVIVSQHPAAVEFIRLAVPGAKDAPVLAHATPDDVRGKVVLGNLPLHLAAYAEKVYAVSFRGDPPRGREYTLADMYSAGAYLAGFVVRPLHEDEPE